LKVKQLQKDEIINTKKKCIFKQRKKYFNCSRRFHQGMMKYQGMMKLKYRARQYLSLFSCNKPMSIYKIHTHVANCCKFKLRTDIEKNPGPTCTALHVDPRKTIKAPYSQGNEFLFGQNAGQQCVAMSMCSLIYNNKKGINSSDYLVQVLNEYWKPVVFKFVPISQTVLFNAD
jgi:hypothetical protein